MLFGNAHSLKPYAWDGTRVPCAHLSASQCVRIWVADPNFPTRGKAAQPDGTRPGTANEDDRFIEISDSGDEFYYDGGGGTIYQGGQAFGGRMYYEPGHIYQGTQVTPFGPWAARVERVLHDRRFQRRDQADLRRHGAHGLHARDQRSADALG